MSKLATTDPDALRPLLHERIDQCTAEELDAVRKTLLTLEARRLADELGRDMAEVLRTGKVTDEKIAEAIREHRQRHPYR